jgi:hypothetical protein
MTYREYNSKFSPVFITTLKEKRRKKYRQKLSNE